MQEHAGLRAIAGDYRNATGLLTSSHITTLAMAGFPQAWVRPCALRKDVPSKVFTAKWRLALVKCKVKVQTSVEGR